MNERELTILWGAGLVRRTRKLKTALQQWHKSDREKGFGEPNFETWLRSRLAEIGADIEGCKISPYSLVKAIEVNALGDPLALKYAAGLEKKKVQSDTNCYVEEGKVYSHVWIKHMVVDYANELAEEIAAKFREKGYSAELWHDKEDSSEVTVCASIDFDKYVELQTKGGR